MSTKIVNSISKIQDASAKEDMSKIVQKEQEQVFTKLFLASNHFKEFIKLKKNVC